TVTIQAKNADGSTNTTSFTVNGSDVAPSVAADNPSVTAPEFTGLSGTGTFSDVDDTVSISVMSGGGSVKNGSASSRAWKWTGTAPDESSPYTVTIQAKNSDGSTNTTSFAVNGSDVAPSVAADKPSVTAPEFTGLSGTGTFSDVDDTVSISVMSGGGSV